MPVLYFGVLLYIFRIATIALLLNGLSMVASSATEQPVKCEDRSVPTSSICKHIEKRWRRILEEEMAGRFKPRPCESKYKDGSKPTPEEFTYILERHAEWHLVYGGQLGTQEANKDHRRANLCGADLRSTKLQGVDLRGANLQQANLPNTLTGIILEGAELWGANFSMSTLNNARLIGAGTEFANFCGATLYTAELQPVENTTLIRASMYDTKLFGTLQGVNLCGADLYTINLHGKNIMSSFFDGATLKDVDLSGATLETVDLSKATLLEVNLRGATLIDVDLSKAYLDLKEVEGLQAIGAKGLSSVTFPNPTAMVTLRKFFKESGLRSEERAVTSALRKFALKTESIPAQYFAKYVLGGWITDYGANPWWSVIILCYVIPPFALFYIWVLKRYERWDTRRKRAGIWAIWPADRVDPAEGKERVRVTSTFFVPTWQARAAGKWWRGLLQWSCVIGAGVYFSLLSAFHIGWRELTVGSWITRLQTREYTLRATGFVRFFSGLQSLISVYLLALWALTYFGRPFE